MVALNIVIPGLEGDNAAEFSEKKGFRTGLESRARALQIGDLALQVSGLDGEGRRLGCGCRNGCILMR